MTTANVINMHPEPPSEASPPPPDAPKKRVSKPKSPEFFSNLKMLRESFALIYGTETVFDGAKRQVSKISAMKHVYQDAMDVWMKTPEKSVIMPKEVIFDPSQPKHRWNLFTPFESKPKKGDCDLIIEHCRFLCANSPEAFEWILNWCAIIVQKPGVKMRTAILMHGNEGAGKNRFWEAFGAILAPYYTTIGQAELGRDFNEWASAKLFIVANEVSTRKEKFEIPGKLKGIISDPYIYINAKGMPPREEENRANFVFLSNEMNPIPLGQTDRRYCVIWTPDAHPDGKAYYDRLSAQMAGGGIAAFHDFLLRRDVGEQDEYARPPWMEAKDNVVRASLGSVDLWLIDMKEAATQADGYDGVAFVGEEGFNRYRHWCRDANERHVVSRASFYSNIRNMLTSKRLDIGVEGSVTARRQATVYWDSAVLTFAPEIVIEAIKRFNSRHPLPTGGNNADF